MCTEKSARCTIPSKVVENILLRRLVLLFLHTPLHAHITDDSFVIGCDRKVQNFHVEDRAAPPSLYEYMIDET